MPIIIKSDDEIAIMRQSGRIVAQTMQKLLAELRPGLVVKELDAIVRKEFVKHDVIPTFLGYAQPPYPATVCVSVNDEIVHGIPSHKRVLAAGDLVKLDVTAELAGYMADAAITVPVGTVSARAQSLIDCAEMAFHRAMRELRPGKRAFEVGRVIEDLVRKQGFSVVPVLQGHGIGRTIHEEPMMPNWPDPAARGWLTDGLVITVEPIIAMGSGESYEADDGWTIKTADGSLAAHFEHTLVVRNGQPLLLTAA